MNKRKSTPNKKMIWGGELLDSLTFNELDFLEEPLEHEQHEKDQSANNANNTKKQSKKKVK